uniref:Signal peptidase complex subunit 1 n=2 Tax=Panagrolaimus sp. JU765 TaxID=591449 RepID=A0AC34RT17_9BILA
MDAVIQMLPPSLRRWSTYIDFPGQQLSERIFQVIIVISSIIGFIVGYFTQELWMTFAIIGVGFTLSNFICLFPWPCFRRHPIRWLPDTEDEPGKATKENKTRDKKRQ